MLTVATVAETIIYRSRYLTEAMSKDLINISSLARYIQPEIESIVQKEISIAAIIMALNRLSKKITRAQEQPKLFTKKPDVSVRSPMTSARIPNDQILPIYSTINTLVPHCLILTTERHTQIIATTDTINQLKDLFPAISRTQETLAAITITLPKHAIDTPGSFYFFLKSLAWEHIPIVELVTNRETFVIIVFERDVDRAYGVIRSLFE